MRPKLAGMKGVHRVVKLKDAVAVVADSWWQAKKALDALTIDWDFAGDGAAFPATASATFLLAGLSAGDAGVGRAHGDLDRRLRQAGQARSKPTTRCRSSATRRWSRRTAPRM